MRYIQCQCQRKDHPKRQSIKESESQRKTTEGGDSRSPIRQVCALWGRLLSKMIDLLELEKEKNLFANQLIRRKVIAVRKDNFELCI